MVNWSDSFNLAGKGRDTDRETIQFIWNSGQTRVERKITLRNCLTMRGGLDFDSSEQTEELFLCTGNRAQFVLSPPMIHDTGEIFHYNDGLPNLVGAVIANQSGKSLEAFTGEYLLNPIGIQEFKWEKASDGLNFGAFSFYLTPRDLEKTGKHMIQSSNWEGKQIVDYTWITQATSIHSGADMPYGYYFWIVPSIEGCMMIGHGGQILFVCQSINLVVVNTAYPNTNDVLYDESVELAEMKYRAAY